ncbi:MAG: hypothetical protein GF308_21400 [Candidatus Heimdallarchaeota archaeon]|nr:hypothetical protein [Candidatus Heimdallarchaeota archaeon]
MVWHAFLKEILTQLFEARQFIVQAEFEIGALPLKIDLVIRKNHIKINSSTKININAEQKLTESLLTSRKAEYLTKFIDYFSNWNLFEFKLIDETLTSSKLAKLIGYFGLFCEKQKLPIKSIKETTSWLICTRKPRKLFKQLTREKYKLEPMPIPGFYKLQFYIPLILVVINELPLEEDFLPVLLFAKGKKRQKVLNFILDKDNKLFINWSYILYQKELIALAKAKEEPLDEITRNVRNSIRGLGIKSVIEAIGLKEVIDAVGVKEVIDAVGVKEVIDAVGPEELAKQLDQQTLEKIIEKKKIENQKK